MTLLINREKLLVAMMGKSSFKIPYQIHKPRPQNRITRKNREISSAFLVRISLIICGNKDTAVNTPATIPTQVVRSAFKFFYKHKAG